MPKRYKVELSEEQRRELEAMRDHASKAYMREKAAAILKIVDGESALRVAHKGLLKERSSDTVYRWWHRYWAEGIAGLEVRKGRGRKAAFSPCVQ
jgi:transposase